MFIQVTNHEGQKPKINTSQIVVIIEKNVHFSNGLVLELTEESMKELEENLYGGEETVKNGATEHTKDLLNELHKLCGGRGEAKPTTDRKARLKTRLKDFSEEDLKLAAKNLGSDEFMQGANDNGKRYGTIDYLLRTSANVNKWLEEQPQKKKGMF